MLFKLPRLIHKHRMRITGVIHAGAHHGQEVIDYKRAGIRNIHLFEPCEETFKILKLKYPNIPAYQFALGASEGELEMNIEHRNGGQSNSLLKPVLHLEQYPEIVFDDLETIKMRTLDSFNITDCNFLNMDVQGYELEVLKGSIETLRNIEYIYTEINRDEVYEGCARIEAMDLFLKDFERVETDWGGNTWGDALYVRKTKRPDDIKDFQPHIKESYPPDNHLIFEEWFSKNVATTERVYLPIHWTSYYVNNKYGKEPKAIQRLQNFINSLDTTLKYYTVVQYDDGILNNVSALDLKVFSMSGHGEPIPLVCQPHNFVFNEERKYIATFTGKRTHRIRNEMFSIRHPGYFISDKKHSLEEFCKIIAQSIFTLCPRGYGRSSFRIAEAVQFGSIPVYISDEFILPPDFESYGVLIKDPKQIVETLSSISAEEITKKRIALAEAYEKYFTYESVKKHILSNAK